MSEGASDSRRAYYHVKCTGYERREKYLDAVELRHLRYFVAEAEHGSFRKSGAALGRSQAAISRCVADLEDQIGASLFHRNTWGASRSKDFGYANLMVDWGHLHPTNLVSVGAGVSVVPQSMSGFRGEQVSYRPLPCSESEFDLVSGYRHLSPSAKAFVRSAEEKRPGASHRS